MRKYQWLTKRNVFGTWSGGTEHSRGIFRSQTGVPIGATSECWEQWKAWVDAHVQRTNEGEIINMRTLTIELRFDADEEGKHEVLIEAAKAAAKHLFTNALLMSTKRKPQIAMYTSDMFAGQEEISMAEDLEG